MHSRGTPASLRCPPVPGISGRATPSAALHPHAHAGQMGGWGGYVPAENARVRGERGFSVGRRRHRFGPLSLPGLHPPVSMRVGVGCRSLCRCRCRCGGTLGHISHAQTPSAYIDWSIKRPSLYWSCRKLRLVVKNMRLVRVGCERAVSVALPPICVRPYRFRLSRS